MTKFYLLCFVIFVIAFPKLFLILSAIMTYIMYNLLFWGTMDTTKWRSIAIRIQTHTLLKGLADDKFRTVDQQIAKLVDDHLSYRSKKEHIKKEDLMKRLLKEGNWYSDKPVKKSKGSSG